MQRLLEADISDRNSQDFAIFWRNTRVSNNLFHRIGGLTKDEIIAKLGAMTLINGLSGKLSSQLSQPSSRKEVPLIDSSKSFAGTHHQVKQAINDYLEPVK